MNIILNRDEALHILREFIKTEQDPFKARVLEEALDVLEETSRDRWDSYPPPPESD